MADFPSRIVIHEEGPREGFQIAERPIATHDKVRLIEALATTGVKQIDCVSYVDPRRVPGMADADVVARSIQRREGVRYTGLWLNTKGLLRALTLPLDLVGAIRVSASETFSIKNTRRNLAETLAEQREMLRLYKEHSIGLEWGYVMTAFGCNYEGEVPVPQVIRMIEHIYALAESEGMALKGIYLADTVGHATPLTIARAVGEVRNRWPDIKLGVHLHDTRGTGMANAYEALRFGVENFDSSCGGLGGCPFAAHAGAAGNVCTEDLVYLCHSMGIETGVDLHAMIQCARMAEEILGRELPGKVYKALV